MTGSAKARRLAALFPDVYGAAEPTALVHKLLGAVGAELEAAQEAVKELLKSHWIDYASGAGLDGLGAIYDVARRRLRDGSLEIDAAFRQRLKEVVPLFAGGGTRRAVVGAVRSALGLPFDLDRLELPPDFEELRSDIEDLVRLEEFSPRGERLVERTVTEVDGASELRLAIDLPSVRDETPTVRWSFTSGGGRELRLELLAGEDGGETVGVQADDDLLVTSEAPLVVSSDAGGRLVAVLGRDDVSAHFTNLDGTVPARLPAVPLGRSDWRFRARGGVFDVSRFSEGDAGGDIFDLPLFEIEMSWVRFEPLTFEVRVPYFLKRAVAELKELHGYDGELFVFEGLPLAAIPAVVDQTRAAGVRGSVQFALNFFEQQDQDERLALAGVAAAREDAAQDESFVATSVSDIAERHDTSERLGIGGVFDVSRFNQGHVFE